MPTPHNRYTSAMSLTDPKTPQEVEARLADLRAKLAKRENRSEYKANVVAIRAEIARLEALA